MNNPKLKAAVEFVRESPLKILSLVIGITLAVAILIFIMGEKAYEKWIPGYERLALVTSTYRLQGEAPVLTVDTPLVLGKEAAKLSRVKEYAVLLPRQVPVRVGDRQNDEGVAFVDTHFFSLFDLGQESRPGKPFPEPGKVVITQKTAEKYRLAAGDNVIVYTEAGPKNYAVQAVLPPFPGKTHLQYGFYLPLNPHDFPRSRFIFHNWGSLGANLYLKTDALSDATARAELASELTRSSTHGLVSTLGEKVLDQFNLAHDVVPLSHLRSIGDRLKDMHWEEPANPGFLRTLATVAAVVLVLALFNYLTLEALVVSNQSRPISIRKILGVGSIELVMPFWLRALAFVIISAVLSLLALQLVAPLMFNIQHPVQQLLASHSARQGFLWLLLGTFFVSGMVLSLLAWRIRPVAAMTGSVRSSRAGQWSRAVMVFLQLAVSVALVIVTATIFLQTKLLQQQPLGYVADSLVLIRDTNHLKAARRHSLKVALQEKAGLEQVAASQHSPAFAELNLLATRWPDSRQSVQMAEEYVSDNFFSTLGTPLLAGREFNPARDSGQGTPSLIINRHALAALGLTHPEEAIGKRLVMEYGAAGDNVEGRIIGVVEDIQFLPGRENQRPSFYRFRPIGPKGELSTFWVRFRNVSDLASIQAILHEDFAESPLQADPVPVVLQDYFKAQALSARRLLISTLLAIALAAIGVYGMAAQTAKARLRELAIRRVLGANGWQLYQLMLKPALVMLGFALLFGGLFGTLFSTNWLASFGQRINPYGLPAILAFGLVLLLVVIPFAVQVWRATKANTAELLRQG
jgi:putative ABC transport system permease protein